VNVFEPGPVLDRDICGTLQGVYYYILLGTAVDNLEEDPTGKRRSSLNFVCFGDGNLHTGTY